jgi:hypothetical protein
MSLSMSLGDQLAFRSSKRRSWRSMEYFGASIQARKAGQRHQPRSRTSITAEITIQVQELRDAGAI